MVVAASGLEQGERRVPYRLVAGRSRDRYKGASDVRPLGRPAPGPGPVRCILTNGGV
jgi:hypothetical protein